MRRELQNLSGGILNNYRLFAKLAWSGNGNEPFGLGSQVANLSTTHGGGFTLNVRVIIYNFPFSLSNLNFSVK